MLSLVVHHCEATPEVVASNNSYCLFSLQICTFIRRGRWKLLAALCQVTWGDWRRSHCQGKCPLVKLREMLAVEQHSAMVLLSYTVLLYYCMSQQRWYFTNFILILWFEQMTSILWNTNMVPKIWSHLFSPISLLPPFTPRQASALGIWFAVCVSFLLLFYPKFSVLWIFFEHCWSIHKYFLKLFCIHS